MTNISLKDEDNVLENIIDKMDNFYKNNKEAVQDKNV